MFLLFLGLGTVSVNAQVRIGGNTAPNSSAVLDLNATDAATGTKGLALPRVNLTSNTMQLTSGVVNLTGMLVYNTTSTLGAVGIYFWNGATWVRASLPSTSAADSGKFLMSNGVYWYAAPLVYTVLAGADTVSLSSHGTVTFSLLLDTTVSLPALPVNRYYYIYAAGLKQTDACFAVTATGAVTVKPDTPNRLVIFSPIHASTAAAMGFRFRCYRPSI